VGNQRGAVLVRQVPPQARDHERLHHGAFPGLRGGADPAADPAAHIGIVREADTVAAHIEAVDIGPSHLDRGERFEEGHAGEAAKAVACVGAQAHRGGVETFGHPEGRRVDLIQMLVQQRVYEQTVSEVGRVRTHLAGATKFDMGQCIKPASEQHCYVTGG